MFKKINLFIVAVALASFVVQSAQAVIVRGTIWSKQREDGTHQRIYCLSDYHYIRLVQSLLSFIPQYGYMQGSTLTYTWSKMLYGLNTVGQEQENQLYQVLSKFEKDETMVLVEDAASDTKGDDLYQLNPLYKDAFFKLDFLCDIAQGCISRGISVINLECRQSKTMAEAHLRYKSTLIVLEKLAGFLGLSDYLPVKSHEIDKFDQSIEEMESEKKVAEQEIESYKVGPFLQMYYGKELEKWRVPRNKFANHCNENKVYNIVQAALLDSPLLDLKAINHIHTSPDKKHIVLAMGGWHIEHIESALPALGYEKIYEDGCPSGALEEYRNAESITDQLPILETIMNHGRTFNIERFIGFNQLRFVANEVVSTVEPKPVDVFNPDKLLVSMVCNYPTRFPFCLLLPKVAQYLREEEQIRQQKEEQQKRQEWLRQTQKHLEQELKKEQNKQQEIQGLKEEAIKQSLLEPEGNNNSLLNDDAYYLEVVLNASLDREVRLKEMLDEAMLQIKG